MVRINLINPEYLSDQHLMAEYDEILMLLGYVRKYPLPLDIPQKYTLGKGHIKFFKNKLKYIKNRHESIKSEMRKRGFATKITIDLKEFNKELCNDWGPDKEDIKIIKSRLIEKIKNKPDYYRYYGQPKKSDFLISLIRKG